MTEIANLNLWWKRQSEGVAHGWRFGEKILQDRGEIATLEIKLERFRSESQVFKGGVKRSYLSLTIT